MKDSPKISEAEWQIMKILWEKEPVTSSEIIEMLKPITDWSPTTVYTLISRLVNKKAISIKEKSSPRLYFPLITEKEYRREEGKSFLKKVYGGSINLMLANIVEENDLSDEEIEELKKILDNGRDKRR